MFDLDMSMQVRRLAVAFVPMLLGIVCHEVAHGWAAWRQGGPTARSLGRLTLNPAPHIDPMGGLMFVLTSLMGPFIIGWAKPVPVNPRWFANPRRGMMLVSLAGPGANVVLAVAFGLVLKLFVMLLPPMQWQGDGTYDFFMNMLITGVWVNFTLAWFNMLPLPPLDGGHVVAGLLPSRLAWRYEQLERYGFVIIILLLASGIVGRVIYPLIQGSVYMVLWSLGLA